NVTHHRSLNQLRRAIKAEMEGVWQSDQMRREPIPVESEALRILERYRVIFKALPPFVKFVKFLVREAFLLHQGYVVRFSLSSNQSLSIAIPNGVQSFWRISKQRKHLLVKLDTMPSRKHFLI